MKAKCPNTDKVAVIAGAFVVVGYDLARELAASSEWDVIGIARRPLSLDGVR